MVALPTIERGNPHFTTCTTTTEATATDIEALLAAIEIHWNPTHPYYYGFRPRSPQSRLRRMLIR